MEKGRERISNILDFERSLYPLLQINIRENIGDIVYHGQNDYKMCLI
jgi:hypothetical protein